MPALVSYQIPTQEDTELAVESSRLLAACIGKGEKGIYHRSDLDKVYAIFKDNEGCD